MKKSAEIHKGHRDRMVKRFLKSPDAVADHEVLETLLYYAIPRIDTNPLAHKLLNMFGSLSGVFSASKEQLLTVEGVGENTATYLLAMGQAMSRIALTDKKAVRLTNGEQVVSWLKDFFANKEFETFVILMLDSNYKLLGYCMFSNKMRGEVKAEIPEVVKAINIHKPKFTIVAHNHPSTNPSPSDIDDFTTKKLNVICEINDINLIDHVIMAGNSYYSYRQEGKLDYFKEKISLNSLFKGLY